jgi:hypothetical protein
MDTDLLAFVTGLDPREAEEVAHELNPQGAQNKTKRDKKSVVPKKVSFAQPSSSTKSSSYFV